MLLSLYFAGIFSGSILLDSSPHARCSFFSIMVSASHIWVFSLFKDFICTVLMDWVRTTGTQARSRWTVGEEHPPQWFLSARRFQMIPWGLYAGAGPYMHECTDGYWKNHSYHHYNSPPSEDMGSFGTRKTAHSPATHFSISCNKSPNSSWNWNICPYEVIKNLLSFFKNTVAIIWKTLLVAWTVRRIYPFTLSFFFFQNCTIYLKLLLNSTIYSISNLFPNYCVDHCAAATDIVFVCIYI